ncbi:NAD-dependent epimerase/dehydratase family protein [Nocardia fluminea]|uniref:NAD-dependent epimerase/dehydratase family protein n=1 Tax=Nocardia fluminea TaxID=134984 RepID=UPI003418659B
MTGYLVSGATELAGAALVLELLDRTEDAVYATAPTAPVEEILRDAAIAYGHGLDFLNQHAHRLHLRDASPEAVIADAAGAITEVWHCPQPIRTEDSPPGGDNPVDLVAARQLLAAAESAQVRRFNLFGTAYVSGSRGGRVEESDPLDPHLALTEFERSSIQLEQLVAQARTLAPRVWRTGVVVGHSRTHAAVGTSPFYGLLDALARTKGAVHALVGDLMTMRAMAIALDADVTVDLVPVDLLVRQAVTLSLIPDLDAPAVHVTNQSPTALGQVLTAAFTALGMAQPDYVSSTGSCLGIEEQFDAEIRSYGATFTAGPRFQQSAAARVHTPLEFAVTSEFLDALARTSAPFAAQRG